MKSVFFVSILFYYVNFLFRLSRFARILYLKIIMAHKGLPSLTLCHQETYGSQGIFIAVSI